MSLSIKRDLWLASGNQYKFEEINYIADKTQNHFKTVISRAPKSADETAESYIGNAKIKAKALVKELLDEGHRSFTVIGDDAGLAVDVLGGQPGVYSGRFSGAQATPNENLELLLDKLKGVTSLGERTAVYHCALHLIEVDEGELKSEVSSEGYRSGLIGFFPTGPHGYAYDSVFLDPETKVSYGEISFKYKQEDSHRSRAFNMLIDLLEGI